MDALAIGSAFYLSWHLRYVRELGPEIEEVNFVPFSVFFPLMLWLVPLLLLTFTLSGLYRTRRGIEWFDDIPTILRGTSLGVMILFAGVALWRYPATSRLTFILVWARASLFVVLGRALVQTALAV